MVRNFQRLTPGFRLSSPFITSAKEGGNVFAGFCLSVCLFVCLCVSKITEKVMDGSF